ncbi:MAG: copper-containing nitrite reductase [Acidimicrobiia bacterium]
MSFLSTRTPRGGAAAAHVRQRGQAGIVALVIAALALGVAALATAAYTGNDSGSGSGDSAEEGTGVATGNAPGTAAPAESISSGANDIRRPANEVAAPLGERGPENVEVDLTTQELVGQLADGSTYTYWTFDGKVPGPLVRIREGDTVSLTLANDESSSNVHSIDLHAVNGPGGGAVGTQVGAGESKTFTFKALNPGVYVYHCATPSVPTHIANGMYGLIVVEPDGGLEPVDKEFYVMQGEVYTDQPRGTEGQLDFNFDQMVNEDPNFVVFNGSFQGLTGPDALQAEVGDRVRIFVGNGGPNLISSFHVIGEIFDSVHQEAASQAVSNVQTTLLPAGGASWVEFTVDVPGTFLLVDHALTRAVDKGALAELVVTGPEDPGIFSAPDAEPEA